MFMHLACSRCRKGLPGCSLCLLLHCGSGGGTQPQWENTGVNYGAPGLEGKPPELSIARPVLCSHWGWGPALIPLL